MSLDKISASDKCEASTGYNTAPSDTATIEGRYYAVCYDKDGNVKWEDAIENLVTTVGKNLTLDTILGNSAAGAVVMGLKGTPSPHTLVGWRLVWPTLLRTLATARLLHLAQPRM